MQTDVPCSKHRLVTLALMETYVRYSRRASPRARGTHALHATCLEPVTSQPVCCRLPTALKIPVVWLQGAAAERRVPAARAAAVPGAHRHRPSGQGAHACAPYSSHALSEFTCILADMATVLCHEWHCARPYLRTTAGASPPAASQCIQAPERAWHGRRARRWWPCAHATSSAAWSGRCGRTCGRCCRTCCCACSRTWPTLLRTPSTRLRRPPRVSRVRRILGVARV